MQNLLKYYVLAFLFPLWLVAQGQNFSKKMVLIKGGEYQIGNAKSLFPDEKPVQKIHLNDFYIDETPVSYADFEPYVKAGGTPTLYWHYAVYNQAEHPVTGLSWYHAIDYCNWRSRAEGFEPAYRASPNLDFYGYPIWELDENANGYRLPSEAEFEICAKSGKETDYAWGNIFDDSLANYDNERGKKTGAWWRLARVKEGYRTVWGLYNMSGNIWHWCNDWYSTKYSKSTKTGQTKALRGGGWGSPNPTELRTYKRSFTAPSHYNYDIGFRCVRKAGGEPSAKRKTEHSFYRFSPSQKRLLEMDFFEKTDSKRLVKALAQYIQDHFPNSLYFKQKVDQQKILTSQELAQLIVTKANDLKINPLFLLGVLAAETAVGSCSFSRWYNNPMAYHWQNRLMEFGEPVYEDLPNKKNRKFRTLAEGFEAFGKGLHRPVYYEAAKKTLSDFHNVYVGYEAQDWIFTISKIYKDIAGIDIDARKPDSNVGQYIYQHWAEINPLFEAQKDNKGNNLETKEKKFALIYGSYGSEKEALQVLEKYQKEGLTEARILVENGRFRLALEQHETEAQASKRMKILKAQFPEVWLLRRK